MSSEERMRLSNSLKMYLKNQLDKEDREVLWYICQKAKLQLNQVSLKYKKRKKARFKSLRLRKLFNRYKKHLNNIRIILCTNL